MEHSHDIARCFSGAVHGTISRYESDCFSNACVTHDTGGQTCAIFTPGAACNTDAHCSFSGKCLVLKTVGGVSYGLCSNGGVGSPCHTVADCRIFTCFTGTNDIGYCSSGELDSQCNTPADCVTNICVRGSCTTGANMHPCVRPSDCISGVCQLGQCVSGDLGTSCVNDSGCRDGNCALLVGERPSGRCTLGAAGDPCVGNADCLSETCVSTRAPEPGVCVAFLVLTNCGEGTCARDGTCYFGRCGP